MQRKNKLFDSLNFYKVFSQKNYSNNDRISRIREVQTPKTFSAVVDICESLVWHCHYNESAREPISLSIYASIIHFLTLPIKTLFFPINIANKELLRFLIVLLEYLNTSLYRKRQKKKSNKKIKESLFQYRINDTDSQDNFTTRINLQIYDV